MKKNLTKILKTIRSFLDQSIGEWKSIRSSHSLAFQEFENTNCKLTISPINLKNKEVHNLLKKFKKKLNEPIAIKIAWEAISDWTEDKKINEDKTILVFSQNNSSSGEILRSKGYAELVHSCSDFFIDQEGGLNINTIYNSTFSFERINFLSKNVRFRYSIIKDKVSNSVIQTSHSSEIRYISS